MAGLLRFVAWRVWCGVRSCTAMTRLRPYFAVTLALLLGLTSYELAAARGQAPVVGTVEVCSGLGLQIIAVDADGNPVGAPRPCPDGVTAFLSLAVALPALPERRLTDGERLLPARELASADGPRLRASARDPPAA